MWIYAVDNENATNLNTDNWRIGVYIYHIYTHTYMHKCLRTYARAHTRTQ